MKYMIPLIFLVSSTAFSSVGIVVYRSGTVIGKEVYAGDISGVDDVIVSRQTADPTLSFQKFTLPSGFFDAIVVPINQAKFRNDALSELNSDFTGNPKLIRAVLLTIFDENNNLREWIQSFKGAVSASTSLADLKTRIAALPDMPDRTVQQAQETVQNKINSGASD